MALAMGKQEIFPPWDTPKWEAVDDRVRGGSSKSHLDDVKFGIDDAGHEGGRGQAAVRFWGTLDTKTLGGAGFASRSYSFGPTPLNLSRASYQGLALTVAADPDSDKDAPHTFTIVLNSSTPPYPDPKPSPGPRPSPLTYEVNFSPKHNKLHEIRLVWNDFRPNYRGREVPQDDPRWEPLKTDSIFKVSIMCRSNFAKQEGDFSLFVGSIRGWKTQEKAREGCWTGIKRWLSAWWDREGQVRLDDEKQ